MTVWYQITSNQVSFWSPCPEAGYPSGHLALFIHWADEPSWPHSHVLCSHPQSHCNVIFLCFMLCRILRKVFLRIFVGVLFSFIHHFYETCSHNATWYTQKHGFDSGKQEWMSTVTERGRRKQEVPFAVTLVITVLLLVFLCPLLFNSVCYHTVPENL